jgi:hypothetical protein
MDGLIREGCYFLVGLLEFSLMREGVEMMTWTLRKPGRLVVVVGAASELVFFGVGLFC